MPPFRLAPLVRRLATGAVATLLLGCGSEGTGLATPKAPTTLGMTVAEVRGPTLGDSDAQPEISCEFDLEARATPGTGQVAWGDVALRFRLGTGLVFDSVSLGAAEIDRAFHGPLTAGGVARAAGWTVNATVPFTVEAVFAYTVDGGSPGHAATTVSCIPPLAGDGAAPTITGLSVAPAQGNLPSDTLAVTYTASSATGLWRTGVAVSGPCETSVAAPGDRFAKSVTRTVRVPLPASCALGRAVTVGVVALDAVGKQSGQELATGRVLADEVPPRVAVASLAGPRALALFPGDVMTLAAAATDNYALRWLVWEVLPAGYRDSVAVSGRVATRSLDIPVRDGWGTGPVQLRLLARDSVGTVSAPLALDADLAVRAVVERPTVAAAMDGSVRALAVDERRGAVYLLQASPARLTVLSSATLAVTGSLALPGVADDLDLTVGGDSLLVSLTERQAIGVIDLRQPALAMTTIPITGVALVAGQGPTALRVAANNKLLTAIVADGPTATSLLEIDLATGTQQSRTDTGSPTAIGPALIERSADHRTFVLSTLFGSLFRYDAATNAFGPRGGAPSSLLPSVDGASGRVVVGTVLYSPSLTQVTNLNAGPSLVSGPVLSRFSSDGTLVYMTANSRLLRVAVADGRAVDATALPFPPTHARLDASRELLVLVQSQPGATTSRVAAVRLR